MASSTQQQITLVPAESFARTYASRVYEDSWQAVQDYRQVVVWKAEHPDDGATSLAKRFDLPKGRVQGWLNDSRPNAVRGLETAFDRGWIDVDPASDTVRGLNALVAWIIQSGSITADTWVPYFTVGSDRDRELLGRAAELAGLELDITRAASVHRSQEMRPIQDGSVLGRVLVVLGAPRGEARSEGDVELPDYLRNVPERLAREFVQLYIHNLGRSENGRYYIHLRSYQSLEYVDSLARLIRELTGESVSTIDRNVVLSKPATRQVAVWDPPLDVDG